MKLSTLLVAVGIAAGTLGGTAAQADRWDHHHGYHGRHGYYGYRHGYRHPHCRTFWRYHHRVTRCY